MGQLRPLRGEIYQVNLDPTIGHEIKKSRPAIIIQNDIGNKYSPLTIVAPITTKNTENIYPIEVLLTQKNSSLTSPSKVLLNQIRAIDKRRLIKKLGRVSSEVISEIDKALVISLGISE